MAGSLVPNPTCYGLERMRAAVAKAETMGQEIIFSTKIKNWMTYGSKGHAKINPTTLPQSFIKS
jgi:hypothetical protein